MLSLSMDYWRVKSIDRFCRLTNICRNNLIVSVCYHNVLSELRSLVYSLLYSIVIL